MSCVKLAIRVRPFTDKELRSEKERIPVVTVVDDNTVAITNIKVSVSGAGDSRERVRHYHADHTFDSSCSPQQPTYASQEKVFETIGREVVASVSRGCSACVLAYGQSATGKTHTMMGTENQPGLIPRLCKALFELPPVELTVSFLEIYNERVHDLLVGEALLPCHSLPRRRGNARKDLRVREHPTRGPYVQNLRRVSVSDVEALLALVGEGARRRQTAATRRNSTSSRSHALIEIATPHATLHLADLAGSEKASWEGCGGGRQKEGANINKSLVALSNVISALVSGGSGRGRFVPYRDSALTWLLKDCFTGGAKAFIIATVSPSAACYGESASTLRWAARARQLPAPRTTSSGPNASSRAALQAQLNQLIAELIRNHIRYIPETGTISYEDQHWTLHKCSETNRNDELETVTNIGNIMSYSRPKLDVNNSESTASSAASGSSDVMNVVDKPFKITNEINKEIDKLFGPALERTSSGVDLKVVAPLRHKRRQCRSQEALTLDETVDSQNRNQTNMLPSHSEMQINNLQTIQKAIPSVTILHENQRAEIVASVTERLYTRLKKKEEAAVSKVESMVDKRIVEPLSELKICTNARQRLMELSKKAIRNKRRIGIPAYTQTRPMVKRVRDQAIDAQTDLLSYMMQQQQLYKMCHDASTETIPMTPRFKEIGAGPTSSIDFTDRSTETKRTVHKNSLMMTDIISTIDRCTQTPVVPPPRRKKRLKNHNYAEHHSELCSSIPVISINISQAYPIDGDTQSSDDNLENLALTSKSSIATTTPDLLTNHNNIESQTKDHKTLGESHRNIHEVNNTKLTQNNTESANDFSDTDDEVLPRVTIDSSKKCTQSEIKNIIMGRNENIYPYNIVLSPPRIRDDSKRVVKFKDMNVASALSVASQTSWVWENNDNDEAKLNSAPDDSEKVCHSSKDDESFSDNSTISSKMETDSFIWKGSNTLSSKKDYVPVYKSKKYKTTKPASNKEPQEKVKRDYDGSTYDIDTDTTEEISSCDSLTYNMKQPRLRRWQSKPLDINYGRVDNKTDDIAYFRNLERNLYDSCNQVENTVANYEHYLANYGENNRASSDSNCWRPKDYLQHLVQLRRDAIRADNDFVLSDNSSNNTFN